MEVHSNRELFDLGRAFAWVCDALGDPHPTEKEEMEGMMYPLRTVEQLVKTARNLGVLKRAMDSKIILALGRVQRDVFQPVPLEKRMDWIRGYDAAKRGLSLAAARKRKGLTQTQLADLVGTSKEFLCRWETGDASLTENSINQLKAVIDWDG